MNRSPKKQSKEGMAPELSRRNGELICICAVLVLLVFAVFGQTLGHGFVNYDDDAYVYENQEVLRGLTLNGVVHAFTRPVAENWHPLTMLSLMLDSELYGRNPGGYHLTNVQLHTVAVILLFLVLENMTGAIWRSGFVAALFAIHPLHVESVAWVAERKDVLSAVFFMLTLGAYVRYVRPPRSPGSYLLVLFLFALGLLSKSMLMTLPCVLLLLDYWPLDRGNLGFWKLFLEKVPLLALSAADGWVTTLLNQRESASALPFSLRLGNTVVSYATYLCQMIYPTGLAMPYPFPRGGLPLWEITGAALLLAVITAIAFVWRRERPYALVGWLWYVGMIAPPALSIMVLANQAREDRYTYLPMIGVCIAGTWAVADWSRKWPHRRLVLGGAAALALSALAFAAHRQTSYWRDSVSLWTHTIECTGDNRVAQYNLGNALNELGRTEDAIVHYGEAARIDPTYAPAFNNLGTALFRLGRTEDAVTQYRAALRIDRAYPDAHFNLANALLKQGRTAEAMAHMQRALELEPADAAIENNFAWMLATVPQRPMRNGPRAVDLAMEASHKSGGNYPPALRTLAAAYAEARQFPAAVQTAQLALQLAEAQSNSILAADLRRELKLYEAGHPFENAP